MNVYEPSSNKILGLMKDRESPDVLSDNQLLRNGSAPWSFLAPTVH
jgi:hypothetical protein